MARTIAFIGIKRLINRFILFLGNVQNHCQLYNHKSTNLFVLKKENLLFKTV